MENNELRVVTQEETGEACKQAIIQDAMGMEIEPGLRDVKVDMTKALRIPFGEMAEFGAAITSMSSMLRNIVQASHGTGDMLWRVTDELGNALSPNVLFKFKDGTGLLGSFKDAAGELHQARLNLADPQRIAEAGEMSLDAEMLFMAIALMDITQKLDAIQDTQRQMFDYLKSKDKGKLQANLEQLVEVMQNYRFYCNDREQMRSQRNLVVGIRKEAKEAIRGHQLVIIGQLKRSGAIHTDQEVRDKAASVRSELEDYRVSVYLYAFSTFLDVMLHGNFEEDYLASLVEKIEDEAIGFRQLYTQAYDLIEADADSSLRAMALGGLSSAMGFLSKAIESTPVGDHTLIDEALGDAGKGLGNYSKGVKDEMMRELVAASKSDIRPFIENIENVSRLYNEPVLLMADENAIYVLPGHATDLEDWAA